MQPPLQHDAPSSDAISYAGYRFPLSLRMVEERPASRGSPPSTAGGTGCGARWTSQRRHARERTLEEPISGSYSAREVASPIHRPTLSRFAGLLPARQAEQAEGGGRSG